MGEETAHVNKKEYNTFMRKRREGKQNMYRHGNWNQVPAWSIQFTFTLMSWGMACICLFSTPLAMVHIAG